MEGQILRPQQLLALLGVKPGDILADFGAGGSGAFTIPAARMAGEKGKVYAVDISPRALSALMGKARLYNAHTIVPLRADLERFDRIPLNEQLLDHALLVNVLHTGSQPKAVLENALRLLKPGGKLLLINYSPRGASIFGVADYGEHTCKEALGGLPCDIVRDLDVGEFYYGSLIQKK